MDRRAAVRWGDSCSRRSLSSSSEKSVSPPSSHLAALGRLAEVGKNGAASGESGLPRRPEEAPGSSNCSSQGGRGIGSGKAASSPAPAAPALPGGVGSGTGSGSAAPSPHSSGTGAAELGDGGGPWRSLAGRWEAAQAGWGSPATILVRVLLHGAGRAGAARRRTGGGRGGGGERGGGCGADLTRGAAGGGCRGGDAAH